MTWGRPSRRATSSSGTGSGSTWRWPRARDAAELARRTATDPRYLTEWLRGQAAGGYVTRDAGADAETYSLTEEQAFCLTEPGEPGLRPGRLPAGARHAAGRAADHRGGAQRRRPGLARARRRRLRRHRAVLPARATTPTSRRAGSPRWTVSRRSSRPVAGSPTSAAAWARPACCSAQAYPAAQVTGSDYHDGSIELARKRAADAGVADRVELRGRLGADLRRHRLRPGDQSFDCLHDMGDPVGAARHVHQALAPDGSWMIVEPMAADDPADNVEPGQPGLLQLLDLPVRAEREVPARRLRAGRPGRGGGDPAGGRPTRGSPASPGSPRPRSTWSSRPARSHAG